VLGSRGPKARDRAYLNGQPLAAVRYAGGVLRWRAEDGNPGSGYLRTDLTRRGVRGWPA